jgi:hypothetical protein
VVIDTVDNYFTNLQTPDSEVDLSSVPWERDLDPYTTAQPLSSPARLGSRIMRDLAAAIIARIPKRRTPGPDGLLGETLRCAPPAVVDLIARLQLAYWDEGYLPAPFKESVTTLLHKKGDPCEPGNYRPIALANTLAKAYTTVVQTILSDFMEENGMLSVGQEGFRPMRHTARQLRIVTSVIEDATLAKRSINLTYVDFSSAFNTVPHAGLLEIMRRKGFPEDAIIAVGAIYSDSVTSILTPHGRTRPIPILRGTIQGDCLSPLLWNICMDPLLRWLDTGDHGYNLASSSESVSAAAYADDLVLPTRIRRDSRIQMNGKGGTLLRVGGPFRQPEEVCPHGVGRRGPGPRTTATPLQPRLPLTPLGMPPDTLAPPSRDISLPRRRAQRNT